MVLFVTRVVCDNCGKSVEFTSNLDVIRCRKKHAEIAIMDVYDWKTIRTMPHKHYCEECKNNICSCHNCCYSQNGDKCSLELSPKRQENCCKQWRKMV